MQDVATELQRQLAGADALLDFEGDESGNLRFYGRRARCPTCHRVLLLR